jgi:hypothetical protein
VSILEGYEEHYRPETPETPQVQTLEAKPRASLRYDLDLFRELASLAPEPDLKNRKI